ncbi:hypothetical protein NCC49_005134 [Naganishia albida]|nr:hypothetical protein NCC49_005134 [Naganishia albida]
MHLLPFLALALTPLAHAAFITSRATTCNGHAELCSRSYGNVTFVGTHNSYAVGGGVADNQGWNITQQLNDGIRLLQAQTHNENSGINLCHSTCTLQSSGLLQTYLTTLSAWLTSNPTEVVTLLLTNPDGIPPSTFAGVFESTGLDQVAYVPGQSLTARTEWPTLGELVDSGKRLVVFMDYDADFGSVPYIIDEFSNVFEDAYDVTSQEFPCTANRTSGSPETTLMLTNHYLDYTTSIFGIPVFLSDKSKISVTNSASGYGSIGQGINNCVDRWARNPNFILLDWYDSNALVPFTVAAELNGVAAPTNDVVTSQFSRADAAASSAPVSGTPSGTQAGAATGTSSSRVSSSSLASSAGSLQVSGGLVGVLGVVGVYMAL